ncbi:MAG: ester cyclase [Hyphomonas sp.]
MPCLTNIAINRHTVKRFLDGTHSVNPDHVDVIDKTVHASIVCHGFPGDPITDHESYKAFFRTFRLAFSDMKWTLHALVADEVYVSARWEIEVKHTGLFAGVEPDGRRVTFDGMVLYRMQDGLIAETWLHLNELRLLRGIGAIPAQAA